MSPDPEAPARLTRRDIAVAAVLTVITLGIAVCSRRAALNSDFLFGDEGHNLLIAQTLLSGGRLYRDVFSQYGPIPAYAHALLAKLFGNTPFTYLCYLTLVSVVNVTLAYVLARKAANVGVAACVALAVAALSVEPGSLVGGSTAAAYLPLERTLLLLVALSWKSPHRRSLRRAILLGCLLGIWQGVKFGGAVFAGAAIVLMDAVSLYDAGWSPARRRAWIESLAAIGGSFAAVQTVWIIWAFAALKPALALDVVWPLYMLRQYDEWVSPDLRWIPWHGWRLMLGQYLLPAAAGAISFMALNRWRRAVAARPASGGGDGVIDAGAVFVPLCFFLLAFFFYFRMVHHFRQFMWTLVPAAAWELERRSGTMRAVTAALWTPGLAMVLKVALLPAAAVPSTAVVLPSGGTLYTSPPMADRIRFLQRFATVEAHGAPVLIAGCRSGFVSQFAIAHLARRTCWDNSVSRPDDEAEARAALDQTVALVDCAERPLAGAKDLRFTPAFSREVLRRLTPWKHEAGCYVYHVDRIALESDDAAAHASGSLAPRTDRGRAVGADAGRALAPAGR